MLPFEDNVNVLFATSQFAAMPPTKGSTKFDLSREKNLFFSKLVLYESFQLESTRETERD